MSQHPAYAAATLAYGIQVEPYSLIYSARAYVDNKPAFDLLTACANSRVKCASTDSSRASSRGSGSSRAASSTTRPISTLEALPVEVVRAIERHLLEETYEDARCLSWMLFGADEMKHYHPQYCCANEIPPRRDWPPRVQEQWDAAGDEFKEWFSFAIPKCNDVCTGHHVCQTIHKLANHWQVHLSDCAFDVDTEEPTRWLLSPGMLSKDPQVMLTRHVRLDTEGINDQLVRRTMRIEDDWQTREGHDKSLLERMLSYSTVTQEGCSQKKPAFHLICIGEKTADG